MQLGCEILIPIGVPMTGFRGWSGVVAEDATVETSAGFAGCRGAVGTVEVRTSLPGWTAASPDDGTAVVRPGAAGPSGAVTAAGAGRPFTACRGAAAAGLARTGVTPRGAVTAAEAGTGFTAGTALGATAEVAAAVEGAGTAEVQTETNSWVGAGCSIHCWIKL